MIHLGSIVKSSITTYHNSKKGKKKVIIPLKNCIVTKIATKDKYGHTEYTLKNCLIETIIKRKVKLQ